MANEEDFLSVLDDHKGILYKVANSYCQHAEDRKDLIQEIIFQLWKSFDKYDSRFRYSTWIYRIALNVAISFYRREKVASSASLEITESILSIGDDTVNEEKETDLAILQQFISGLKELDRALMLLYLEEKAYREIAEIMGITETNVATRIARIKTKLKQQFAEAKKQ